MTNKEVKKQETYHEFYCDNCNKLVLVSMECEDGWYHWYQEPDYFESSVILLRPYNAYKLQKCLCEDCSKVYREQLIQSILNLGFKEEK